MQQYSTTTFANERDLKVEHVACFLASVGVTIDKAETWRQWVAAYVDMGLMKHPEDPPLLEVKKASCARINKDRDLSIRDSLVHQRQGGSLLCS